MPQTRYEKIYCQIAEQGGGGTLPTFEDFRRNDPQVQALLLKRPAARLGIDMPPAIPKDSPSQSTRSNQPMQESRGKPAEPESTTDPVPAGLNNCRLNGEVITCPGQRFRLATNKPNKALAAGVLDESNRMGLPGFTGDLTDETAVRRYLSDAYDRYIAKMLEIGLGGATMSFTRFYHSFRRHESQGIDFAQRMESTFMYLKQDKRNLGVSARLNDALPESLKNCVPAGSSLIVCDNVATNWVFVQDR